jgi:multiple sugar transport system permease protein
MNKINSKNKEKIINIFLYLFLIGFAITMIMPFLWMFSTSLKTLGETMTFPPKILPSEWLWSNYYEAVNAVPFGTFLINSTIVTVFKTLMIIITSLLAAYGFARFEFPGKNILFLFLLAILMVPGQVLIIPQFILIRDLGWLDTYWALIVPGGFSAFGTFLLRQNFKSQPKELFESATIDGCSAFGALWRIAVPNAVPTIMTLGFLSFIFSWNDFLWPMLVTRSEEMMVVSVGLTKFQGQYVTNWPVLMSGAMIALLPVLLVFLLTQKYIVEGIAHTSVKG